MAGTLLDDIPLTTIDGGSATLGDFAGQAVLVVNVASKCGFTPQYAGLEALWERYRGNGLTVLGFPCNQFGQQEPGTEAEIQQFCSTTYGVTFPMFAKVDVNGADRHPLFAALTEAADEPGDVTWNFEKFLVSKDRTTVTRFRTKVEPDDADFVDAVERAAAA
jgi:glutathione peroxidase